MGFVKFSIRDFIQYRCPVNRCPAILGPAILGLFLMSGCAQYIKPKYEVGDRKVVIIPFRDLSVPYGHGYGESKRGLYVTESFRSWSERNWSPYFSSERDWKLVTRVLKEWAEPKITPTDWRKILGSIEADLALIGEINSFRTRDPKLIGAHKGRIEGQYSLLNTKTGRPVYKSGKVEIEYPKPAEFDIPLTEFGTNSEFIENRLLKSFGEQVGKDLYGYYEERR